MLTPNQKQFIYWITERESIRLKKEAGLPAPWTDNKVMQETYFCNVNRENDRVTKWIRNNWQYKEGYKQSYTFAMVIARLFNLPSTLEAIQQPPDDMESWLWDAEDTLLYLREQGQTIFNGAYIVSTNGKKMGKVEYIMELLHKASSNPVIVNGIDSVLLSEWHKALMGVEGLASFLAAQVIADLKNTKGHPLHQAEDWWTFSAFGPGSLRGLSWFWEKEITRSIYQKAINDQYDLIGLELPDEIITNLHYQDLQNCNCEFDKFMRVTNGTGRSKRKYRKGK